MILTEVGGGMTLLEEEELYLSLALQRATLASREKH